MSKKQSDMVEAAAAIEIWNAGVAAAGAEKIVRDSIGVGPESLSIAGETYDLGRLKKVIVVGFGKCSGAMAAGFESVIGELKDIELSGLVIVPAGETASTVHVTTTVGRPRASNFPTQAVVDQTTVMLDMVAGAGEDTLIVAMVSGGGSALLESPLVPLDDLIAVSRDLSSRGASIESLNTVRRALSDIKAGGLARHVLEHSQAKMVGLIISDVIGDSLSVVASGPTVISNESVEQQRLAAREVLLKFDLRDVHGAIYRWLEQETVSKPALDPNARIKNYLIANNATAVTAAQTRAIDMKFSSASLDGAADVGIDINRDVNDVAEAWVELALNALNNTLDGKAIALVAGGEPTVVLCDSPGRGGRNLQLAALVLQKLSQRWGQQEVPMAFVSGGTDGEDGNTSVAGAGFDSEMLRLVAGTASLQNALKQAILAHDCEAFFERHGSRIMPPDVSTNVCDVHVMLIGQRNVI